jgi:hypothetical protein
MSYVENAAATIDWQHPLLAAAPASLRQAAPREQLLAVIHCLREQPVTWFGFDPGYFAALRAADDAVAAAQTRVDTALGGDLYFPCHSNAFAALGPDTLCLGLDSDRSQQLAAAVLARQPDWGTNVWTFGITRGVASLLRYLCPHPAVADADLLPLLGWLLQIAPAEWDAASNWSDTSLGPSGHNWWVHSLFGIWQAGALFGCFHGLSQFATLLPAYLEREVELLFNADGWSREGAAGYHRFAVAEVIAFTTLAQRHGVAFSARFHQSLQRLAGAQWQMMAPDGDGPMFGDCSPGRPPAGQEPPQCGELRCLAARFSVGEAKFVADALGTPPRPLQFLPDNGRDLAAAYEQVAASAPPLDTALQRTGLYAMRSGWTPDADWMAINAMAVGTVVSSHQHADIFNLELAVNGERLLVDNWYGDITADDGSYESTPEIRNNPMKRRWRVGSTAHNVATVDQLDQVPVRQVYRYGWQEQPRVEGFVSQPDGCWFSGFHEAYRHDPAHDGVHRRSVFYRRSAWWLVLDRFSMGPAAERTFQQHFFVPRGSQLTAAGQVVARGTRGGLLLVPVTGVCGDVTIEPNPHPIGSYDNPDHLQIEVAAERHALLACMLVRFDGDTPPAVSAEAVPVVAGRELSTWEALGIRLTIDGERELLVRQQTHWSLAWECDGHHGASRLFHSAFGELPDLG